MNEFDRESPARAPGRGGAATFLLGALVGAALMAGAMTVLGVGRAPAVDLEAIKAAARDGAKSALDGAAVAGAPLGPQAPSAGAPAVTATSAPAVIAAREANTLGKADAPVTLVEYSDFQCPYCLRHYTDTQAKLIAEYVNTGKVKIVFKNFPIPELHPQAMQAAVAAECAADQGKFWAYHDVLFARFGAQSVDYSAAGLSGYATGMSLDKEKFENCLRDDKIVARINADRQEGSRLGVRGTPTFFVNGQALVGAQPYTVFKQVLDSALAGKN
ncbi:MAG: thioredoxin domain-containing protein [Thermoflexales bacterium]|nr:thioredoxin domain-containing protein [Thermoflexales bacterium]